MDHRNEADIVNKDAGLAYELDEERNRLIYNPVCKNLGDSIRGKVGTIHAGRRICDMRKAIGKHLKGRMHLDALHEREKELRRNLML